MSISTLTKQNLVRIWIGCCDVILMTLFRTGSMPNQQKTSLFTFGLVQQWDYILITLQSETVSLSWCNVYCFAGNLWGAEDNFTFKVILVTSQEPGLTAHSHQTYRHKSQTSEFSTSCSLWALMAKAWIRASRRPFSSTDSRYCAFTCASSCSSCCMVISRRDNCKFEQFL